MSEDDQPVNPFLAFIPKPPTPAERIARERRRFVRIDGTVPHLRQAKESLLEVACVIDDPRIYKALQHVNNVLDFLEVQQRKGPQVE